MDTKRCCLYYKALLPILLPRQEIVTIISLHLERFATGQVHALSALRL